MWKLVVSTTLVNTLPKQMIVTFLPEFEGGSFAQMDGLLIAKVSVLAPIGLLMFHPYRIYNCHIEFYHIAGTWNYISGLSSLSHLVRSSSISGVFDMTNWLWYSIFWESQLLFLLQISGESIHIESLNSDVPSVSISYRMWSIFIDAHSIFSSGRSYFSRIYRPIALRSSIYKHWWHSILCFSWWTIAWISHSFWFPSP